MKFKGIYILLLIAISLTLSLAPCCPGKDPDKDGICDPQDNCPTESNPSQEDIDNDGKGDICDPCPEDPNDQCNDNDLDKDGILDDEDNCVSVPNPDQSDIDSDKIGDLCDNCKDIPNPDQTDSDADGIGDACEESQCIPAKEPFPYGAHYAGKDCMKCHTTTAPIFTISGTLYNAVTDGQPVGGATIVIKDANGEIIELVTATNGNFYTTKPVTFPIEGRASQCPYDVTMSKAIENGSCNSCHTTSMRIHLP